MKKLLFTYVILITVPSSFAVCSIDSGESLCTLPEFRGQIQPIYQQGAGGNSNINSPSAPLQPLNRQDPIEQMRGPNNNLIYNSGCQFGICLKDPQKSRIQEYGD